MQLQAGNMSFEMKLEEGLPGIVVKTNAINLAKSPVVTHACRDGVLLPVKVGSIGSVEPSAWVCCQLYAWGAACPLTLPATLPITTAITDACRPPPQRKRFPRTVFHLCAIFTDEEDPSHSPLNAESDRPRILASVALIEQFGDDSGETAVIRSMCVNPIRQRRGYGTIAINVFRRKFPIVKNWFLVAETDGAKRFWARSGWSVVAALPEGGQETKLAQSVFNTAAAKRDDAQVYSLF